MEIREFPSLPLKYIKGNDVKQGKADDFAKHLSSFIDWVNRQQLKSKEIKSAILRGENIPLHSAIIEFEKASVALNLLIQIRNKLLEAFQELQRMQV